MLRKIDSDHRFGVRNVGACPPKPAAMVYDLIDLRSHDERERFLWNPDYRTDSPLSASLPGWLDEPPSASDDPIPLQRGAGVDLVGLDVVVAEDACVRGERIVR